METKDIINEILISTSPEEVNRIEKRMLIATKIDEAIKSKGWKKKDLMQAMKKNNPSEITRWLSGTHNFTIDTLADLERVLDIRLLNLENEQPIVATHYKPIQLYSMAVSNQECHLKEMHNSIPIGFGIRTHVKN